MSNAEKHPTAQPVGAPQADSQPAPVWGATPGEWFVRKLEKDGVLKDCFVAAPDFTGCAYDAEILGDDEYRSDVLRKLADCELIVAAVKQYRASRAPADSVLEDAARYPVRKFNRYCHAHMCQETDDQHEPDCPQGRAARKQGGAA